jgi:4-hydroxybenzoate polyprenyltransferase
MKSLNLNAWLTFCRERFALVEHALMIACFTGGNAYVATKLAGFSFSWLSFVVAYVVTFSFFFRLRLFDEIKDYEFDIEHNPTRPLARGLIKIPEVKSVIFALTAFEILVVGLATPYAAIFHLAAIAYSYLMYKEFFIGDYIRPHLTTYAVMHTLVSAFVGFSIAAITSGEGLSLELTFMGVANWAQFNLFEFARKTFAQSEEKPNVDSYSSLFRERGAALLSFSQVLLGIAAVYLLFGIEGATFGIIGLAAILSVFICAYVIKKDAKSAKFFRTATSLYLLLFYVVIMIYEVI